VLPEIGFLLKKSILIQLSHFSED